MLTLQPNLKDKMTPLERAEAITSGRPYDRIRCNLSLGEFKAHLYGVSMDRLVNSVEDMVNAEITAFNRFGQDGISMGANSYGIADALGAHVCFPPDALPYIASPALTDYHMLDDMAPIDPLRDGRIPLFLEACGLLAEQARGIVGLGSSIGGPFTIASYLRGVEPLLHDLYKQPQQVHRLMRLVTDSCKRCVDCFSVYKVSFAMADPVASGSVISKTAFQEFVYPYLLELTEYVQAVTGKKPSFHMCGKTRRLWPLFRNLQVSSISLDNREDLDEAKAELGDIACLAGNVAPVAVMLQGGEAEINEAVQTCIRKGADSPMGYILGFGCQIPPSAPFKNVDSFMAAAREYGSYSRLIELASSPKG